MNASLSKIMQTRLSIEPCLARWGGVPCSRPLGHAGPHESVASQGGCSLRWRSDTNDAK